MKYKIEQDCGKWKIARHDNDMALYARCPCGYEYNASCFIASVMTIELVPLHNFCPNCGEQMKGETE